MTPTFLPAARLGFPKSVLKPRTPLNRLDVIWALMSISMLAFIASYFTGGHSPILTHILEISSSAGCGLCWLLSRALFRTSAGDERWTYAVVGVLFLIGFTLYITGLMGLPREGVLGFVARISTLISSTMLLLPIFEAVDGISKENRKERVFRLGFLGSYGLILTTAMIVSLPAFAGIEHTVQMTLSALVLCGTAFAANYRKQLTAQHLKARADTRSDGAEGQRLARALTDLLEDQKVYLEPDIKVSDIAQRLRTAQYKVTRCITGQLAFTNFNQMINTYRIDEAKRLLADPGCSDRSVLSIAMDSGFGSIGPFNRAFKQRTSMTPLEFRKSCRKQLSKLPS